MATILELAELSNAAYETSPVIGSTPVSGWTIIDEFLGPYILHGTNP